MELNLSLRQSQQLSPQMVQNLKILQMNSQQLLEYVEELSLENPTVELSETPSEADPAELFRLKLRWLRDSDSQNRVYYRSDGDDWQDPFARVPVSGETLEDFLLEQLIPLDLPEKTARICRRIISSLDENGFFPDAPESLASALGCSVEDAESALSLLRTLEPYGVAARDLPHCLAIQLEHIPGSSELAKKIALSELANLGRAHYAAIAKHLGASLADVRAACGEIRALNPRISAGFASKSQQDVYITPDVIVVNFPDHFEILTNDFYFPTISISRYYNELCRSSDDAELRAYLREKLRQASWAIKSIGQRKSTILRCAEAIVRRQEEFFRHGRAHLQPMTLADIAAELEIHESTVSRAVKDKYIQCVWGIFPIAGLFSRNLGGSSPDSIKSALALLIDGEEKPLSDRELSLLLAGEGYTVSRRTVAKYRAELGIGGTSVRRAERKSK